MRIPRICLFEPDIPQNTAAVLRTAACLGMSVDIIEPCGFAWNERKLRRAGMDYLDQVNLTRHSSWQAFLDQCQQTPGRLVLATTKGSTNYTEFRFQADDYLLFGRESAGVPDAVHDLSDARILIPLQPQARSLNLAASVAIISTEALRQTDTFPPIGVPA